MARIPKQQLLRFIRRHEKEVRPIDDTVSLCVLVREEFGIELTLQQGSDLFETLDQEDLSSPTAQRA